MNTIIKSEKEARNLFINGFCGNTHHLNLTYSQDVIDSYHKFSSMELEHQWRKEEYAGLLSKITPKNPLSIDCFLKANYWKDYDYPITEFLQKVTIIFNHHKLGQRTASKFVLYSLRTAAFSNIEKGKTIEEQAVISLYSLCCNLIDKYDIYSYAQEYTLAQTAINEAQTYKYKILGVKNEAEAEKCFRNSYFSQPEFQTKMAQESYDNILTAELQKLWIQNYLNEQFSAETTKKDFKLYQCIELLQKGLATKDNLLKLYDKLKIYKTALLEDNYINVAYQISRDILPLSYKLNDIELTQNYILLSEELVNNTKHDYSNYTEAINKILEDYRILLLKKAEPL